MQLNLIIKDLPDERYSWCLGAPEQSLLDTEGTFTLGCVDLKGHNIDLHELDNALTHFDESWLSQYFDETAQLQLGKYLYQLVFAEAFAISEALRGENVSLRIVSEDNFVQRLPWNLLCRDKTFLVLDGWHISTAVSCESDRQVTFPVTPKILLVCPEPQGYKADGKPWAPTHGKRHAESIIGWLRASYEQFLDSENLALVHHFSEFQTRLAQQAWDVIYFYGHGDGNDYGSTLVFTEAAGYIEHVSMMKLAELLKPSPPSLMYLNACRSGNGSIGSAAVHLHELVPSLVVNRTDAFNKVAQEQAQAFLMRLLIDQYPPHQAITSAYGNSGTGINSVRWMTPVFYQHYKDWSFPERELHPFASSDTHWYLKLDRTAQFGQVNMDVSRMLVGDTPNTVACFWYGTKQQGVETFHQRLPVQLRELNPAMELLEFDFRWPDHWHDEDAAYHQMICEGFGIKHIDTLPAKLQSMAISPSAPLVSLCRFATLYSAGTVKLGRVAGLLRWWNMEVHPKLQKRGLNALLTVSYELDKPMPRFIEACEVALDSLEFDHGMEFKRLDELTGITEKDVKDFLHNYAVRLPIDTATRNQLIADTLKRSDGNYELMLKELQTIVARARMTANQQLKTDDPDLDQFI